MKYYMMRCGQGERGFCFGPSSCLIIFVRDATPDPAPHLKGPTPFDKMKGCIFDFLHYSSCFEIFFEPLLFFFSFCLCTCLFVSLFSCCFSSLPASLPSSFRSPLPSIFPSLPPTVSARQRNDHSHTALSIYALPEKQFAAFGHCPRRLEQAGPCPWAPREASEGSRAALAFNRVAQTLGCCGLWCRKGGLSVVALLLLSCVA